MRGVEALRVLGLLLLSSALHAAQPPVPPADDFVRVRGTEFTLRGAPYRFVGTNLWYAAWIGRDDGSDDGSDGGDRARVVRELDFLATNGITNLRLLGAAERSPLQNSMDPAISYRGVVENENLLEGLDYFLDEMGKRDMQAVIFLNNFWEWSGGMVTYLYWVNGGEYVNLGDPAHPWPEFALFSAQFYSNRAAQALFRDYVSTLWARTTRPPISTTVWYRSRSSNSVGRP
ncbi:MAG: hypothetical protein ACSLE2_10225 [Lysobacterales bacterium]